VAAKLTIYTLMAFGLAPTRGSTRKRSTKEIDMGKRMTGSCYWASVLFFLAFGLLSGCGGGQTGSARKTPAPSPAALNIAGNWQFGATPTGSGEALGIAGDLNQSGKVLSGAVHVSSLLENCFDHRTTVSLTGTLTDSSVSLTSASVGGQVMTITGSMTDNTLSGTYKITGGCGDGQQGSVTGNRIPSITSTLSGTFTTSSQQTFDVTAQVTQGSASPEGSFGISGTVTFGNTCLSSGTITSGTFPSGSFMIGTAVVLRIETSNGIVTFTGTGEPTGNEVNGDYTVSGGSCDQTGAGRLIALGQWDY
jgi:hypothetical protein